MGGAWEELTGWIDRWRTNDGDTAVHDEEESQFAPVDYDPEALMNRSDITAELGVLPAEFVRGILEAEGGKLWQQDFQRYGNFSEGAISRLLQDLEGEGVITRYRIGKEKIVTLPDESVVSTEPPEQTTTAGRSAAAANIQTGRERPPKIDN